jgi:hypothetical protein
MADVNVRSDSVDVEHIMRQIRARVREKRGVDYTEAELQQLAKVKLEKFLDPGGVRSDLLEQFRSQRTANPAAPNYEFEEGTLYETHRGPLRALRKLLRPLLKLFFNPDKITTALHIQSQVNTQAERRLRHLEEPLWFELLHNLTVEITRLGIEVQNLKMRVESLSSRVDFDERRARALEGVVQYRPAAPPQVHSNAAAGAAPQATPGAPARPAPSPTGEPPSGEPRRRRRRRRRRRPGQTMADGSPAGWQNRSAGAPDTESTSSDAHDGATNADAGDSSDGPFDTDGPEGPDDADQ